MALSVTFLARRQWRPVRAGGPVVAAGLVPAPDARRDRGADCGPVADHLGWGRRGSGGAGTGGHGAAAGPVGGVPGADPAGADHARQRKRRREDYPGAGGRGRAMQVWQMTWMGRVFLVGGQEVKIVTGCGPACPVVWGAGRPYPITRVRALRGVAFRKRDGLGWRIRASCGAVVKG
jgi:hypothetical protein